MKKLFYLVALVAAVTFTACGNKSEKANAVPAEITEFIASADEELGAMNENGMSYQGTALEDHDIVVTIGVDESMFYGMGMKAAFEMAGMTEDAFAQYMKAEMFSNMDEKDMKDVEVLREYKYNIVFRLVGSESGDQMNCKIGYDELPK